MDYFSAFAISGSGMSVEKLRLDVTALNLANMNSTRAAAGDRRLPMCGLWASLKTSQGPPPWFKQHWQQIPRHSPNLP